MKPKAQPNACPCGGIPKNATYADCCQPIIEGRKPAASAEHLMRSRYTAYVLGNADYLLASWHPDTRPALLDLGPVGAPHGTRWLGLTLHSHTRLTDTEAQVMFTARYRERGQAHRLKEHSRFVLENGQWFYVDGDTDFDATT